MSIRFFILLVVAALLITAGCNEDSPTSPDVPPDASVLQIDSLTYNQTYFSWTMCNSDNFESYRLYRSLSEGIALQDTLSMDCVFSGTDSSFTTCIDSTFVPEIQYFYALVTHDKQGLCSWSNEVSSNFQPDCPDSVTDSMSLYCPRYICFTPDGSYAYVSDFMGSIYVIDTATFNVVDTIEHIQYIDQLCMLPSGDFVYAVQYENTDSYQSTIVVISTSTNSIVKIISTGLDSRGLCSVPGKDLVYVCNVGDETIAVIDTQTHTIIETIPAGTYNTRAICSIPSGEYVYAARANSDDVIVISTETNTIVETIPVGYPSPASIVSHPSGEFVFVATWNGHIGVIRTSDNTLIKTIDTYGGIISMCSHPSGEYIYAAGNTEIAIIDTNLMQKVSEIESLGENSYSIASHPSGEKIYAVAYPDFLFVIE